MKPYSFAPGNVVVEKVDGHKDRTVLLLSLRTGSRISWWARDTAAPFNLCSINTANLFPAEESVTLYTKKAWAMTDADHERSYGPPDDRTSYHSTLEGPSLTIYLHQSESELFEENMGFTLDSDVPGAQVFGQLFQFLVGGNLMETEPTEPVVDPKSALPDLISAYAVARSLDDYLSVRIKDANRSEIVRHYEGMDKFRGVALATGLRYAAWSDVAVDFTARTQPWGFFLDNCFADALVSAGFKFEELAKLEAQDFALITALMQLPIKETGGRAADALATVTRNLGIQ